MSNDASRRKCAGDFPTHKAWLEYDAEERDEEPRTIYFIQQRTPRADGPIKIGIANEVGARLRALSTGSAFPLDVLATVRGGPTTEYRIHHRLSAFRLQGEWFSATPEVIEFIETAKSLSSDRLATMLAEDAERSAESRRAESALEAWRAKPQSERPLWKHREQIADAVGLVLQRHRISQNRFAMMLGVDKKVARRFLCAHQPIPIDALLVLPRDVALDIMSALLGDRRATARLTEDK